MVKKYFRRMCYKSMTKTSLRQISKMCLKISRIDVSLSTFTNEKKNALNDNVTELGSLNKNGVNSYNVLSWKIILWSMLLENKIKLFRNVQFVSS
jgi:hypothetical protein